MTKLSVNVNKVATLRNTRPQLEIPSVVHAARLCLAAGAHGITVHPRPDQRHIKPRDVDDLALLLTDHPGIELNIEGNPFTIGPNGPMGPSGPLAGGGVPVEFMPIVERIRPAQATLVPDTPNAVTSDHGWDLRSDGARVRPLIERLHALGARVSLFMDPVPDAMTMARDVGADRVELYTEPYAAAFARGDRDASAPYAAAAERARALGLGVNAGHDLNLANLPPFLERVQGVDEVSIGHALIADALELGLHATVRAYLRACGHA
ncbi:MAG TPA: pyridoxine 5'-phosphate synthase [Polyangiaceae bacterium]|jgi:pyridoxine 5-phosphate synthase